MSNHENIIYDDTTIYEIDCNCKILTNKGRYRATRLMSASLENNMDRIFLILMLSIIKKNYKV